MHVSSDPLEIGFRQQMNVFQRDLNIPTSGRGFVDISGFIEKLLVESKVTVGLCHIFCMHTSASLTITENADPSVHDDLLHFMEELVPDGSPAYTHRSEGDDDLPAHVRSVLTDSSLSIPISNGRLNLGIWQGIYLLEHRYKPASREICVTITGNDADGTKS